MSIVLRRGLASVVALAGLGSAGCATMSAAELDRNVTVSAQAPLYEYRRIVLEPVQCEGPTCDMVNGGEIARVLGRPLVDACYEVVDAEVFRRYYDFFFQASGVGMVDWAFAQAGLTTPGAVKLTVLDPMAQQVMVEELGLEGLLKSTITLGVPDDITHFRPASVDFQLIDARGRQVIWHARLDGQIVDDSDTMQTLRYMSEQIAGAIGRKANACGEPQSAPEIEVKQGLLELPDRIYFELGSAQIAPRSHALLDDLAYWFTQHPEVKLVRIEGHTDDTGDDASNLRLSDERAQAVHAYLASKGVDPLRIEPEGYGETRPLVSNDSPLNRSKNRRVEFHVVK